MSQPRVRSMIQRRGSVESFGGGAFDYLDGCRVYLREIVHHGLEVGTLHRVDGVWRRTGDWQIPPGLLQLVRARVERLNSDERRMTELLAFAGELDLPILISLDVRDAVPAIEAKGLVSIDPTLDRGMARLSHPLHAEAIRALQTKPTSLI